MSRALPVQRVPHQQSLAQQVQQEPKVLLDPRDQQGLLAQRVQLVLHQQSRVRLVRKAIPVQLVLLAQRVQLERLEPQVLLALLAQRVQLQALNIIIVTIQTLQ